MIIKSKATMTRTIKEHQELRGNPMWEKTTDDDEYKKVYYVQEYRIDLKRSIRD